MEDEDNGGSKLAFFLAGMGLGAMVTLLFAPKSGKETRRYLADKAEEGKGYLARRREEIRGQAGEWVEKGQDWVAKRKGRLADAVKAGKKVYRDKSAG